MKTVIEIKATRTFAGPGTYAYDAEATVLDTETDEVVYVHVNWYDDFENYTVSNESLWDEEDDGDEADETELFDPNATFTLDPEIEKRITEMTPEQRAEVEKTGRFPWDEADDRYIEEYDKFSATKGSAYRKVFELLRRVLNGVGTDIK